MFSPFLYLCLPWILILFQTNLHVKWKIMYALLDKNLKLILRGLFYSEASFDSWSNIFVMIVLRQTLSIYPWVSWNSLFRTGRQWRHINLPASVPKITGDRLLKLKACTMPPGKYIEYFDRALIEIILITNIYLASDMKIKMMLT